MAKIAHIFSIPFTGFGACGGYRGDRWFESRIRIFKNFVIPSLIAQSKKEFVIWCQFRPEEETNPLVVDLWRSMNGIRGLSFIFTFFGPCLYDDKYDEELAKLRLMNSLSRSLPALEKIVADADWIYLTCQPSDDLYAVNMVERIQAVKPKEKLALAWKKGYICNYSTKEIAEYNPDTTPPFATIIFPKEIFLDAKRHFDYIGPYKSHEYVDDNLNVRWMDGRGYLVGCHGTNISTTWSIPYKGREILDQECENVWLNFGIWDTDPVMMHKGTRLYGRWFFNKLPRAIQPIIKTLYHKVRSIYVR